MNRTLLIVVTLLLTACVARHTTPNPSIWVVNKTKGKSFKVQGRRFWYRLSQSDTASVKVGDSIYINFKGHEWESAITRWR